MLRRWMYEHEGGYKVGITIFRLLSHVTHLYSLMMLLGNSRDWTIFEAKSLDDEV